MFLLTNARVIELEQPFNINTQAIKYLQKTVGLFSNELNDFKDYDEVVVMKDLAECFPEGYLTANGYHSLFLRLYGRGQSFDYVFSQIDNYFFQMSEGIHGLDDRFFNFATGDWLDKQEDFLFQFVIDNLDDLQTSPLDTIDQVVDRFCQPEFMDPKGLNFFLSLSNRLEGRIKAGEPAAEALQNRIMSLVLKYRQTRTGRRGTRR
jgi:hypothetical protein